MLVRTRMCVTLWVTHMLEQRSVSRKGHTTLRACGRVRPGACAGVCAHTRGRAYGRAPAGGRA